MLAEHEQAAASAPPPPEGLVRLIRDARTWVRAHKVAAVVAAVAAIVVWLAAYSMLVAAPAQRREREELEARAVERLEVETAPTRAGTVSAKHAGGAPDVRFPRIWRMRSSAKKASRAMPA
jgi:hypothetical protein